MKPIVAFILTNITVVLLLTWFVSSSLPSQINAASSSRPQPVSVMIFAHHDADDVANAIAALRRTDVNVHMYNIGSNTPRPQIQGPPPVATKAFAFGLCAMLLMVVTGPFFFLFGIIYWLLGMFSSDSR